MEVTNLVNLIAILVTSIGILVGLAQLVGANKKDEIASRLSFCHDADQETNAFMTRIVWVCMIVILLLYVLGCILAYPNTTFAVPHERDFFFVELALVWGMLLFSATLNEMLSLKDIKIINRWITDDEILSAIVVLLQICILVFCISASIIFFFDLAIFGGIGTLLLIALALFWVFAAVVSFLREYFRLRTLYEVSDTRVILKGLECEYNQVHSYRFHRGHFIFICSDDGFFKKIQTYESNVLLIEQMIDVKTTLKDIKLQEKKKQRS